MDGHAAAGIAFALLSGLRGHHKSGLGTGDCTENCTAWDANCNHNCTACFSSGSGYGMPDRRQAQSFQRLDSAQKHCRSR